MEKAKAWVIEGKDKLAIQELDIPEAGDYEVLFKRRYALYVQWIAEHTRGRETTDIHFLAAMSAAVRL